MQALRFHAAEDLSLGEAVPAGFEALLDPGGTQLKILIDLSK